MTCTASLVTAMAFVLAEKEEEFLCCDHVLSSQTSPHRMRSAPTLDVSIESGVVRRLAGVNLLHPECLAVTAESCLCEDSLHRFATALSEMLSTLLWIFGPLHHSLSEVAHEF